jgi:hypothetical protein
MNSFEERNRREVFRLRLPSNGMLQATIGGQLYQIIEVSELSLWVAAAHVKNECGICSGVMHWSNGEDSRFTGEIGHFRAGGRIICNVKGIRMKHVIAEQRRLLTKFPIVRD